MTAPAAHAGGHLPPAAQPPPVLPHINGAAHPSPNGAAAPAPEPPPTQHAPPDSHVSRLGGRPTPRRRVRFLSAVGVVIAAGGTGGVTVAAFALSFDGIRATAIAAYIRPDLAWLFPVAVGGAMAVAVVCAVLLRQLGRPNRYPWFVVLATSGISVACNALHAYIAGGSVWAMAVSAMPAVLLSVSAHLTVLLIHASSAPVGGDAR